jgi:hypothetical protein
MAGTYFPEPAAEPYLQVGEVRSAFARIDPDGQSVSGYFDRSVAGGAVEFGYDEDPPLLRSARPFDTRTVTRLDRARLPAGVGGLDRFPPVP